MLAIIPQNYRDLWVFYSLTNAAGECLDVGVCKFTDLMQLDGFSHPDGSDIYMTVIEMLDDRDKLLERARTVVINRGWRAMEHRLHNIYKGWHKRIHGNARRVMCNETGETWKSVTACAIAEGTSITQLSNHLRQIIGYRTVKGKTYRYV